MSKHTPISDQENAEIDKAIEVNQYVDNSELNLNIANLRAQANKNPEPSLIKTALNSLPDSQPAPAQVLGAFSSEAMAALQQVAPQMPPTLSEAKQALTKPLADAKITKLADAAIDKTADLENVVNTNPLMWEQELARMAQERKADAIRQNKALLDDRSIDTIPGQLVNAGVAALDGGARVAGQIGSLPFNMETADILSGVAPGVQEAFEASLVNQGKNKAIDERRQEIQKKAVKEGMTPELQAQLTELDTIQSDIQPLSEEQTALLGSTSMFGNNDGMALRPGEKPLWPVGSELYNQTYVGKTNQQVMDGLMDNLKTSEDIDNFWNQDTWLSGKFNDSNRDVLLGDFGKTYDKWFGDHNSFDSPEDTLAVAGMILEGAGDLITNPGATLEYVAENLPQLLLGSAIKGGLALTNVSYAMDEYRKGIQEVLAETGALPNHEQSGEMLAWSLSLAVAEQLGDASVIRGLRRFKPSKKVTDPVAEAVKKTVRDSLIKQLGQRTGTVAKSFVGEGLTEGYQTAVESTEVRGKDLSTADPKEVYTASMIGAGAGSGTVAPGQTLGATKDVVQTAASNRMNAWAGQAKVRREKSAATQAADEQALGKAIETGDFTEFAGNDSTDSVENTTKVELVQKIGTIAAAYEDLVGRATETQPVDLQESRKLVNGAAQVIQVEHEAITALEKKIVASTNKSEQNKLNKELVQRKAARDQATEAVEAMKAKHTKLLNVGALVDQVTTATTRSTEFKIAGQEILELLQVSPESLANAKDLLSSPHWTKEERNELQLHITAEQSKDTLRNSPELKSTQSVQNNVIDGGDGYRGAEQYRSSILSALDFGNDSMVNRELNQLRTFVKSHTNKAKAFALAYAPYGRKSDNPGQPLSASQEETEAKRYVESTWKTKKGKPYNVSDKFSPLVDNVQYESQALQDTLAYLEAAVNARKARNEETKTEKVSTKTAESTKEPDANPNASVDQQSSRGETTSTDTQGTSQSGANVQSSTVEGNTGQTTSVPDSATQNNTESETVLDNTQENQQVTESEAVSSSTEAQTDNSNQVADKVTVEPTIEEQVANSDLKESFSFNKSKTNILHHMGNLADALKGNLDSVAKFLRQESVNELEEQSIRSFGYFADSVSDTLQGIFDVRRASKDSPTTKKGTVLTQIDPAQNFADENGNLTEEASTAIAAAVYNWIATKAGSTLYNNDFSIAALLGIQEENVTNAMREMFGEGGVSQTTVSRLLGAEIVRNLGLRNKDKTIPANHLPRLEQAMGNLAIAYMRDQGIVESYAVTAKELGELTSRESKADLVMLQATSEVNESGDATLSEELSSFVEMEQASNYVVGRLFETTFAKEFPSLTPINTTVTKQKGTVKNIAEKMLAILRRHQIRAHQIAGDTDGALMFLTRKQQEDALGVVTDESINKLHESRRKGAKGKQRTQRAELNNYAEFRERMLNQKSGLKSPFYFAHEIWKNQRIGMVGNVVNTQRSKIQRGLIRMNAWVTQVDPNNNKQRTLFLMGVAQGIGVTVGAGDNKRKFDALTRREALDEVEAKLAQPVFEKAIDALVKIQDVRDLSESEVQQLQQAIVDGIKAGGEGSQTLHALTNYARMKAANGDKFTSDLALEIDGIANGIMIGTMQFMPGNARIKSMLARGGIFLNNMRSFGEYKARGNKDTYENLASIWSQSLAVLKARNPAQFIVAERFFTINRQSAKDPVLTTVYGAGVKGIVNSVSDAFIENILIEIETIVNGPESTGKQAMALKKLDEDLKLLTQGKSILPTLNPNEIMEMKLDYQGIYALRSWVENNHGVAVMNAIKQEFGEFIKNRTRYNEVINAINDQFVGLFEQAIADARKEAIDDGTITKNDDLPVETIEKIIADLQGAIPGINNAFSVDHAELMQLAKQGRSEGSAKLYKVETKLGRKVDGVKSINSTGQARDWVDDLGVSPTVLSIHSLDAAVALQTLGFASVLNVHDGFYTGVLQAENTAKTLNNVFYQAMKTMSLAKAAYQSAVRAKEVMVKFATDNAIKDYMQDGPSWKAYEIDAVKSGFELAKELSAAKDKLTAAIRYVTQYNLEGVGYSVAQEGQSENNSPALDVPHSELGYTATSEDPDALHTVQMYLRVSEKQNVDTLIGLVLDTIDKRSAHSKLLNGIREQLGDAKVVLVEPDVDLELSEPVSKALRSARAVYDGNTHTVYLKSTGFHHHAMTSETIAHELIHALINRYLEDPSAKRPKAVREAIADLDALMTRVKNDPVFQRTFASNQPMVASIDEFITWGMTNEGFQNYLKSRTMETKGKRAMTGFRHMINAIQKIIFGKSDKSATNNALYELMENAGTIMSEARSYKPADLDYSTASQEVEKMTSREILESLGNMDGQSTRSDEHVENLSTLQATLVDQLQRVLGMTVREMEDVNADQDITFLQHLKDGTVPFTSSLSNLFGMSYQESYVAEQLEATLGSQIVNQGAHSVAIKRLWTQAKDQLKPEDFLDDSGDMDLAKARYQRLFSPKTTSASTVYDVSVGKNVTANQADYLQAFTIMAMVHEPTRKLLEKVDTTAAQRQMKVTSLGTLLTKIRDLILDGLARLGNTPSSVKGTVGAQAQRLVQNLASIEHKKRARILRQKEVSDHGPNAFVTRQMAGLRKKLQKPAKTQLGKAARIASILTEGDKADGFINAIQQIRNKHLKERNGSIMSLAQEFLGETALNSKVMRLMRWSNRDIDQQRKQVKDSVRSMISESFGKPLTEAQETALTKVMVMTDLSSLLDQDVDYNSIVELVINDDKRKQKIKDLEAKLKATEHGIYYINQARALGLYMVENASSNRNLSKNAHNIAMLYGDSQRNINKRSAERAMPLIDQLATLHALERTSAEQKEVFKELALQEGERKDGNGVSFVLHQHAAIQKDAFETIFDSNPVNVVKGYMHQITNPHLTVKFATSSEEVQLLKAQGYRVDHVIRRDSKDPSGYDANGRVRQPITAMVVEDGGIAARLAGVMSYTNKSSMGTSLSEAMSAVGENGNINLVANFRAAAQNDIDALHQQLVEPTKGDGKGALMIPIFDHQGNVQDYRYEMEEQFRSRMLEKHYDVTNVMGAMAGNLIDKVATKDINEKTIKELSDQYSKDPDKKAYIMVGKRSSDPKMREVWNLLPEETKQAARDQFDGDRLMIRTELFEPVFGYRKASITDLWAKSPLERSRFNQFMVKVLELTFGKIFGDKLIMRLRQGEAGWQELLRGVKDILVVKTGFTLIGNIISNTALLWASGVPLIDIAKNKTAAWKGVLRYQKEHTEVFKLQSMLAAQPMSQAEESKTRARIAELENSLANNPVKELVDAGLFQTIVEDINIADDPFSYKSKLFKKTERLTANIPQGIKTAASTLTMSQDTPAYKFLHQSTQVSDFAARYTQYKYYTERGKNPLSKEEAMKRIVANFVNYDVPTGKGLQYLNDMGLVMFSKYYIRIQRPIIRLAQENPLRMLTLLLGQGLFDFAAPTDSSLLSNGLHSRLQNPFSVVSGSFDEIATINGLLHGTGIK